MERRRSTAQGASLEKWDPYVAASGSRSNAIGCAAASARSYENLVCVAFDAMRRRIERIRRIIDGTRWDTARKIVVGINIAHRGSETS